MKITKRQLRKLIREALSTEVPELTGGRKSSFQVKKEKELAAKKAAASSSNSAYDNLELMNKAVMDAIFKDPMSEEELVRVATEAAPGADEGEVLDFIDELLDQGTIEFNEDIGMYDLP